MASSSCLIGRSEGRMERPLTVRVDATIWSQAPAGLRQGTDVLINLSLPLSLAPSLICRMPTFFPTMAPPLKELFPPKTSIFPGFPLSFNCHNLCQRNISRPQTPESHAGVEKNPEKRKRLHFTSTSSESFISGGLCERRHSRDTHCLSKVLGRLPF